jgi:hypothetical protein
MVQKKAFAIILGNGYSSYQSALSVLHQQRLDARRLLLCSNFALKCSQSTGHMFMFPDNPNYRPNMRNSKPFMEFQCKTSRYFKSPIPFLARLLNKNSTQHTP